jgi:hypothetical protein
MSAFWGKANIDFFSRRAHKISIDGRRPRVLKPAIARWRIIGDELMIGFHVPLLSRALVRTNLFSEAVILPV